MKKVIVVFGIALGILVVGLITVDSNAGHGQLFATLSELFTLTFEAFYKLQQVSVEFRLHLWESTPEGLRFLLGVFTFLKLCILLVGIWSMGFFQAVIDRIQH